MDIHQLYKLYINYIYHYLLSLCKDESIAEDLTQDTFMKAYLALENSSPKALKSWLIKIAYHTFIDYTRRSKKVSSEEPEFFSNIPHDNSTEEEVERLLQKKDLSNKLDQLKPLQKKAIILCDLQGYSYKEATAILCINENTLKSHIFRGRGKLRQLYKKGSVKE